MSVPLQNVTHACFGLSYLLAFALELVRLRWPVRSVRGAGLVLGAAGLVAHSAFLAFNHPTPATPYGALLAVAWVLAVFYLYGALHHTRYAWAVFVLPVVLGLVGLSFLLVSSPRRHRVGTLRIGLLATGFGVQFTASCCYLLRSVCPWDSWRV